MEENYHGTTKNEKGALSTTRDRLGFKEKTLWDWLNLLSTLLIPLVVVGVTVGFGWWQAQLANQQQQADQQNILDQQRASILQTYIDDIQDLLLNHNLQKSSSFDPSNPYYDTAILAQARTLSALQVLDPDRKGRLLLFLYQTQLIGFAGPNDEISDPIISLSEANLNKVVLNSAELSGVDLSGADLNGANLNGADLRGADLGGTDLREADLSGANLIGADLSSDILSQTDLNGADLNGANLNDANLSAAYNLTQQQLNDISSCINAILPKELVCHSNQ